MMNEKLDSTKDLLKAIQILEEFSQRKEAFRSLSLLKKTIFFAQQLLFNQPSKEKKKLYHALEVIKKNLPLLETLKIKGTTKQRQLASLAYAAIDRFNAIQEKVHKRSLVWRHWMHHLRIEFSQQPAGEKEHTLELMKRSKILSTKEEIPIKPELSPLVPSKLEMDAFRMKAITLLKHHKVCFTSLTDPFHLTREIPIVVIENSPFSKAVTDSIVSMQQTLSAFPGETVKMKGSFRRSSQNYCHSVPIPETFLIEMQSHQSGFPHPMQRHGWALSPSLLPPAHPLADKMHEIAQKLMPEASLNGQAKEVLRIKRECFDSHAHEFLDYHSKLNKKLLEMAKVKNDVLVDRFFSTMRKRKNSYINLCTIHHHAILQYLENQAPALNFTNLTADEQGYVKLMGYCYQQILARDKSIFENMAARQLQDFIFELENPPSNMHQWLLQLLTNDLSPLF